MRVSEERLRLAQQAGRIGAFEWNIQNGVNIWTPELEALYGLPQGGFERTQEAFENLVHPDDRAEVVKLVDWSLKTGQPTAGEWRAVWPDGSIHWIAGHWQAFRDASGRPLRVTGINIDFTERKIAEEALAEIGRKLIEAQEEERTRIARELHDDISQRIALLTITLEGLKKDVPDSVADFKTRLDGALEQLVDIGSDVQAISRRLHSSKLEYLGLAAAARSFCEELSAQQKVEIEFSHTGISKSFSKEVSLCLFRVLQEGLHNAVKHSGMRHFAVELLGTEDAVCLRVSDQGIGFDPNDSLARQGLGLVSMQERVQLVGGDFLIESKRNVGTTIRARVPLKMEQRCVAAAGR